MEVTVKEAANKKSSLRFPSLPDKEIRVKGNAKYQKYDIIKKMCFQAVPPFCQTIDLGSIYHFIIFDLLACIIDHIHQIKIFL